MSARKAARDERGRFAAGGPGGPGRRREPSVEFRRAVEEAISPEHVGAVIRKATTLALQGNLSAMRLVLDRTCGRAAEAPTAAVSGGIELPSLQTATDCNQAIDRLLAAVCSGGCDRDTAKTLMDVIQLRLRAIEAVDHEQRLAELENAVASADTGPPRKGRGRGGRL